MNTLNTDSLRCPTCRAEQPWSDTCRRCKCDLRLLREVADEYAARRKACLANLGQNQNDQALEQARRIFVLHADEYSQRLLAVCELLNGNWSAALVHGEQVLASPRAS